MPLQRRNDSRGRQGFHWLADVGERFAASARDGLPGGPGGAPRLLRKVAVFLELLCWRGCSGHRVTSLSIAHGFSDRCPGLVRPAVARTATARRVPRAAVGGVGEGCRGGAAGA